MLVKAWVPITVSIAVAIGGVAVVHLRDAFGSEPIFSATGRGTQPLDPTFVKHVTYDVYGTAGTAGSVSYLDMGATAHQVDFTSLPWTLTITTTTPAVLASVVAQGDGSNIGCRITVNGVVKAEQSATGHDAQISCLAKAA